MIALVLAALAATPSADVALPSGVKLIHVDRRAPFSSFALAIELGSDADPEASPGLARAAAIALEEKIRAFSGQESTFDRLGGSIACETGPTATIFAGGAPADRFEEAMAIVFRAIADAKLEDGLVERAIGRAIEERRALSRDAEELARAETRRSLFGFAPAEGEVSGLSKLTRAELEAVLAARIKGESMILAIAGAPFDRAAIVERASAWTAVLPKGRAERSVLRHAAKTRGKKIVVVDHADPAGPLVVLARAIARPAEARVPAFLAAAASIDVLGARAELDPALSSSAITLHAPAIAKAVKNAIAVIDRARHGPTQDQILTGKRRAATRADAALADPAAHAIAVTAAKIRGEAAAAPEERAAQILRADDAAVASAARTLLASDDLTVIIIASANPALIKELAAIPGIRDVSIVSTADR